MHVCVGVLSDEVRVLMPQRGLNRSDQQDLDGVGGHPQHPYHESRH